MKQLHKAITSVDAIKEALKEADHVDVKSIDGAVSMRTFIAGMLNYYPAWIKTLYRIRWGFVRLLGMKQQGIPDDIGMGPEDVPMTPGETATFFTVDSASEEHYWLVSISEAHLTAHLGVVVEPLTDGRNRFYTITIVHYNKWTGPVYFNVIRPFHHIVVGQMMQAGVKSQHEQKGLNHA